MRNPIAYVIAAVVVLLALLSSAFTVNEGQTALVLNLGKIVRSDLKPGLHFKWPMVEEVRKFDRRILSLDDKPARYLTAEKKDVEVDFFVKWRISNVTNFYRNAGGGDEGTVKQRLLPIVKNSLNDEINHLTLQQVVSSGRSDLTSRLLENINKGASPLGIHVLDVRIKKINLPQDGNILDSVFNRMRAERTRVANQLRAEGTQGGEAIRAEADRQRQVIVADAERDAQKLRGEGDAESARIYAEAANRDPGFYAFQRSLEAYRKSFAGGDSVIVLERDDPFLQYMRSDR